MGFGVLKMLMGLLVLGVLLVLLISTSFFSDFVLRMMNRIPIHVNAVAAASHEIMAQVLKDEANEAAAASAVAASAVAASELDSHGHHKKHSQHHSHMTESTGPTTQEEQAKVRALADDTSAANTLMPAMETRVKPVLLDGTLQSAQAIVVLGGGLARDAQGHIIPNIYTQLRLRQAISQQQVTHLPIFLTGVEAPYMQEWLEKQGASAEWLEGRSMNTCENARFSALMLQKLGGAPKVELVTDAWHIPRARWLFAMNGIETVPIPTPLPADPSPWWPDWRNVTHTRRAMHELVAFTRDRWFGTVGCREIPS